MDILFVDDDDDFRASAARWMGRKGHRVAEAADGLSALSLARERHFDVAILDLNLPDQTGLDLLQGLRDTVEEVEILMLTGAATVETAVEAMKRGACDYLSKPFPLAELEERCVKAAERGRLRRDGRRWKVLARRNQPVPRMLGDSPAMQEVRRLIERVAPTDAPVLISGETGTGKELVARAIQQASRRTEGPFVTVNCAALPEALVESELFGHEKGAFTGAAESRPGLFEIAGEGTLFIDEIGELPASLQPKLLRVLEDGSLRRVGSSQERHVDVRIVAATNRDLTREVAEGRFREDLLYRINVVTIAMPALRDRSSDIPFLVQSFLPAGWDIEPEAEAVLVRYRWPGNVRQLKNVLERATILAEERTITVDDLPAEIAAGSDLSQRAGSDVPSDATSPVGAEDAMARPSSQALSSAETSLESIERSHVLEVLRQCQGNKSQAARLLGIHRRKLYRLLDRLGIGE